MKQLAGELANSSTTHFGDRLPNSLIHAIIPWTGLSTCVRLVVRSLRARNQETSAYLLEGEAVCPTIGSRGGRTSVAKGLSDPTKIRFGLFALPIQTLLWDVRVRRTGLVFRRNRSCRRLYGH